MRPLSFLAAALYGALAHAQTTVYSCTATLILPTTVATTVTTTSTRAITVTSVQYSVSTTTSVRTTTVFGGGFGQTVTQTVTAGGNCGPTPQPTQPSFGQVYYGSATHGANNINGGACSFNGYTPPNGILTASLSDLNWNNALYCGACINVRSGGRSVTVMIVDQGGPGQNGLSLSQSAFQALAPLNSGSINVDWQLTTCNINSNIVYVPKEGSSSNYLAVQVQNSRTPITKFEVSADRGRTWTPVNREAYNFFTLYGGSKTAAVDIRLTDIQGKVIQDSNIDINEGRISISGGNFF